MMTQIDVGLGGASGAPSPHLFAYIRILFSIKINAFTSALK